MQRERYSKKCRKAWRGAEGYGEGTERHEGAQKGVQGHRGTWKAQRGHGEA